MLFVLERELGSKKPNTFPQQTFERYTETTAGGHLSCAPSITHVPLNIALQYVFINVEHGENLQELLGATIFSGCASGSVMGSGLYLEGGGGRFRAVNIWG